MFLKSLPFVMLSQWVREALAVKNMSQAGLARELTIALGRSIDRAAVNKMASNGRQVAADELLAISKITGHPMPDGVESDPVISYVPLLDFVSAGRLAQPASQIPVEDVPLLAFADLGPGEWFALKVKGDSMNKISPDGSVIVVNRADNHLVSGKSYVFSIQGETTFKRWQGGDPPYLESYSTETFPPIFPKSKRGLAVIGRVKRTVLDL